MVTPDLFVCESADRAADTLPLLNHYLTEPCEARPWTSASG
jgi:hypothetical protein